jgi:hypothetical protein
MDGNPVGRPVLGGPPPERDGDVDLDRARAARNSRFVGGGAYRRIVRCRTCYGPAGAGFARCRQCELARRAGGGLLADTVAAAGYAVRGGPLAEDLRRYKSAGADDAAVARSRARLRELLARFLRDHGEAVWRAAGMPAGPSAAAVVPTGQGRPGPHPLAGLVRSCLALPLVPLTVNPAVPHVRGVSVGWLEAGRGAAGADVLVVDDTWVSGGSAQSAAAALKLAGARRVAVIVLGRHVNPGDPASARFLRGQPGGPAGG